MIDSAVSREDRLGPNELLEKGRLLDQMGRYDDAWAAFTEGKAAGARLPATPTSTRPPETDRPPANFFNAGRLRLLPRAGVRSDVPSRSLSSAFRVPARRWWNKPCRRSEESPPATSCR